MRAIVNYWKNEAIELNSMAMGKNNKRPKFLNLFRIRLPVTGITSIAHRISGALMFLSIPFFIYVFSLSLRDQQSFQYSLTFINETCVKLILSLITWSFTHHVLAGIRFLLTDVNVGTDLYTARKTAWVVNILAIVISAVLLYRFWI